MNQIKREADQSLCSGCLSSDRTLTPIKENIEILKLFFYLSGNQFGLSEWKYNNVLVCWECSALLRKTQVFQRRVQNAQFMLRQSLCQLIQKNASLSTLSYSKNSPEYTFQYEEKTKTHKQNQPTEKEKIDVIEDKDVKNVQTDIVCKQEPNYEDDETFCDREDFDSGCLQDIKQEETIKKEKISHKIQNKKYTNKAKIKVNPDLDLVNIEKSYTLVQLSEKEMEDVIENERKGSVYKKMIHKCKECRSGFNYITDLHRHKMFEHIIKKDPPYKCLTCDAMSDDVTSLRAHWMRHNYVLRCALCPTTLRGRTKMKQHLDKHKYTYTCCSCHAQFGSFQEFSDHYKALHKQLTCDHCGLNFSLKSSIMKHMKSNHLPPRCYSCNVPFPSARALRLHRICHHDRGPDRPYCVECDKHYRSNVHYKRHLATALVHGARRDTVRIPCPDCGKVFSRKLYMTNHYKLVHSGGSKHHCQLCNKYFSSAYSARQHKLRVHDKRSLPRNKICDLCGRGFTTNRILINHRRTHTGERPFACTQCASAFAQQAALASHVRSQHRRTATSVSN